MTMELRDVSLLVSGETHIHRTDLVLKKGTMNVLLGRTSSGKTSLMRLIAGLDQPSSGRLFWDGEDVTGVRVQDRAVAMVYQQFINYPNLSVYDNIASPLRIASKSNSEIDKAVQEAAALMKLSEMLDRFPSELSGGQQQRCALARALVKGAKLVLLDEPLANLDYKLREELRVEIPKIFEKSGAVFIYATTEPEEALLLGGNTVVLHEGRVVQFGETTAVYRAPVNIDAARIFSDPPMNFASVSVNEGRVKIGDAEEFSLEGLGWELADGNYQAGFRPNHVKLAPVHDSSIKFTCISKVSEVTGSETFLHLQHDDADWVGLIHGIHSKGIGLEIDVFVALSHIYFFAENGELMQRAGVLSGMGK